MAFDFSDLASARLISQLSTSTTTGVTLQANRVNGAYVTWPTGQFILCLKRVTETDTYFEKILVASGTTQNSTTGVVTLGTLSRNISGTDGSDRTGSAATVTWPSGTLVYVPVTTSDMEQVLKLNEVNTMGSGTTAIRASSVTTPAFRGNRVTTSQRLAMSPANGDDSVYDTDIGAYFDYTAGAWVQRGAAGTYPNAANTVAGKVDIASNAELQAGTATDATSGAINVVPVSQTVASSVGAGDNGKIPRLGSSGTLAIGFLATGTPNGSKFVRDDGTLVAISSTFTPLHTSIASSSQIGDSSTSEIAFSDADQTYTFAAGALNTERNRIKISCCGEALAAGTPNLTIGLRVGGTRHVSLLFRVENNNNDWHAEFELVTRVTGASGTVRMSGKLVSHAAAAATVNYAASKGSDVTLDLTDTQLVEISVQYGASNAANLARMEQFNIDKISAPS